MSVNTTFQPLPDGPWRNVPMNAVRLYTIWLNKTPRPHGILPPEDTP